MSTPTHAPPGWFGKLSCLGDFADRRLPPDWVRGCDEWLMHCMVHGQQTLGTRWLPTYLAAPLWRFAWGPQVAGEHWWFGVLMPSCDSVGRYFPLVLAQPRLLPPDDRFGLDHLDLWWTRVAQAALETLADGASVDRFEAALEQVPPWPAVRPAAVRAQAAPGGVPVSGGGRWAVPAGASATDLARALAAESLGMRLHNRSLWWPWHADGQAGACTLLPGLPTPERFTAMLAGG